MAYKRYVYKKGKKFGPYYYESYRDKNGVVKKKYVGTTPPKKDGSSSNGKKNNNLIKKKVVPTRYNLFLLICFIFLILGLIILNNWYAVSFTGKVISQEVIKEKFEKGEVGLDIVEAPEYVNAVAENQNKRMDFEVEGGLKKLQKLLLKKN